MQLYNTEGTGPSGNAQNSSETIGNPYFAKCAILAKYIILNTW